MSTDKEVTKDLLKTLEDGKNGFAKGAEKLDETNSPELAKSFRRFSEQRAGFEKELQQLAKEYGDSVHESGTVAAALHRGWMSLKDAVSGSDPKGVLGAAEQGEDHAVKQYEDALKTDVSTGLRTVLERQCTAVRAAHNEVRAMRDSYQPMSH